MEFPSDLIDRFRAFSVRRAVGRTVASLSAAAVLNLLLMVYAIGFLDLVHLQTHGGAFRAAAISWYAIMTAVMFGAGWHGKRTNAVGVILVDGLVILAAAIGNTAFSVWYRVLVRTGGDPVFDRLFALFILMQFGWAILRFRDYAHSRQNIGRAPVASGSFAETDDPTDEIRHHLFSSVLDPDEHVDIEVRVPNPAVPMFEGRAALYRCFASGTALVLVSHDVDDVVVWEGPTQTQIKRQRAMTRIADRFRERKQQESDLLLLFRRFLKRFRGAVLKPNPVQIAELEHRLAELFARPDDAAGKRCLTALDETVREFLARTRDAWSLHPGLEDMRVSMRAMAWMYGPREGSALAVFYRDFPPLAGEFLLSMSNDQLAAIGWGEGECFVLTNLRLIQKDGKDGTFKEVRLSDVAEFVFKGTWREWKFRFHLRSAPMVTFDKLQGCPDESLLRAVIEGDIDDAMARRLQGAAANDQNP